MICKTRAKNFPFDKIKKHRRTLRRARVIIPVFYLAETHYLCSGNMLRDLAVNMRGE